MQDVAITAVTPGTDLTIDMLLGLTSHQFLEEMARKESLKKVLEGGGGRGPGL